MTNAAYEFESDLARWKREGDEITAREEAERDQLRRSERRGRREAARVARSVDEARLEEALQFERDITNETCGTLIGEMIEELRRELEKKMEVSLRIAILEQRGLTPHVRGTWQANENYSALDVCVYDGASWIAKYSSPGPLPGEGWQIMSTRGKAGPPGPTGPRGEQGPPGVRGERGPVITGWSLGPSLSRRGGGGLFYFSPFASFRSSRLSLKSALTRRGSASRVRLRAFWLVSAVRSIRIRSRYLRLVRSLPRSMPWLYCPSTVRTTWSPSPTSAAMPRSERPPSRRPARTACAGPCFLVHRRQADASGLAKGDQVWELSVVTRSGGLGAGNWHDCRYPVCGRLLIGNSNSTSCGFCPIIEHTRIKREAVSSLHPNSRSNHGNQLP